MLSLAPEDDLIVPAPLQKEDLIIAGATGATSDEYQNDKVESPSMPAVTANQEDDEEMVVPIVNPTFSQKKSTKKQSAVISYQKKAKLFTNANQKLNIDTDAINELFNYGGEKG